MGRAEGTRLRVRSPGTPRAALHTHTRAHAHAYTAAADHAVLTGTSIPVSPKETPLAPRSIYGLYGFFSFSDLTIIISLPKFKGKFRDGTECLVQVNQWLYLVRMQTVNT